MAFYGIFYENGTRVFRSSINGVPNEGNEIDFRGKIYKVLKVRFEQARTIFDTLRIEVEKI